MGIIILLLLISKWSFKKFKVVAKDIFLLTRRFCKEHWERIKKHWAFKVLCRVVECIEKFHLYFIVIPDVAMLLWEHVAKHWPW